MIAIKVENISKLYRLGNPGSGRLREDIRFWLKRQNADKYLLWALKDINFEINQGEVMGFIGNNGAGKSTLLKIISSITTPTTGSISGRGTIASLLEVGSGFHGDLTGRENIFLNGNILGMKSSEIKRCFDEIIAFSGVEELIDTPVKHYSSGMYMRLAFAIAAHLNPEILIVDEVLAVGDVEFQRKCLGKMKEISDRKGKTVLFVSHNTQALQNLCDRVITLHKGHIIDSGKPETVIANYLKSTDNNYLEQRYDTPESAPGNDYIRIKKIAIEYDTDIFDIRTPFTTRFEFWYSDPDPGSLIVGIHLFNMAGECIFDVASKGSDLRAGLITGECNIPGNFLNNGAYYLSIVFVKDTTQRIFYFEGCLSFNVEDFRENTAWFGKWMGYVRPAFPVILKQQHVL
ncbi:ABC transporter ATP-binding protein [[Flexibacter] sp. ATCC 35208]|uniref:ABC transporter ATP-binding protein n=1 Tax=[Flexibacter] sp. ATCC 35208 TaxID=1936242 RepID=UPI0009CB8E25|nr:ABC transporter ATP-binding protein [[Flexibacter] sp. ATCC 35208]OMP80639.1 ABC transporter ATP-binding protein [[Flexibacter] sp. ATCC 35208]